jgi:hypothetical protein
MNYVKDWPHLKYGFRNLFSVNGSVIPISGENIEFRSVLTLAFSRLSNLSHNLIPTLPVYFQFAHEVLPGRRYSDDQCA